MEPSNVWDLTGDHHLRDEPVDEIPECPVLVIYTGGTIGMIHGDNDTGLVPAGDELIKEIKRSTLFNDPDYVPTPGHEDYLSLPNPRKKRIIYKMFLFDEVMDSSNINFDHWSKIATTILNNYNDFDGFVVLHGTDTLAYTASALSFICEHLGKPIIITGSQVPLFELMSDGRDNFICSLLLAGAYCIPEVTVFFNHRLFRGNRVTKSSSTDYEAFDSFNHPPLASVGVNINVDHRSVLRPSTLAKFTVHTTLNRNVGLLRIHPSITNEIVRSYMEPPMEGVVLQTYGAGNVPSNRKDIMEEIKAAVDRGIIVINCSQCLRGAVSSLYETGKVLSDMGVITGGDMTAEAALTKLAYVLSKKEWDLAKKKKVMEENLRGELTAADASVDGLEAIARSLQGAAPAERSALESILYPSLLFSAVCSLNVDRIQTYLDYGADINTRNFDGRTPLHLASCQGNFSVVQFLLLKGASVHARDRYGQTPLMDAVRYGHEKIIALLVQNGAHLSSCDWVPHACRAAARGQVEKIRAFNLAGADFNLTNTDGRTPLHEAVLHGRLEVVKYLLSKGARCSLKDTLGMTALEIATKAGHAELRKLLALRRPTPPPKILVIQEAPQS